MVTLKTPTGPIDVTGGLLASDETLAKNAADFLGENRKDAAKLGLAKDADKDSKKDRKKGW